MTRGQIIPRGSLLLNLLSATRIEWGALPAPFPLFLHEGQGGLAGSLGVAGDCG